MSEIDKPVRKTYPTNRERDEEIERLRNKVGLHVAEIEQLRSELLAEAIRGQKSDTENEKLRNSAEEKDKKIKILVATLDDLQGTPCEQIRHAQEIERLRADVVHWREARRMCLAAGDMMKAEIERLREENALLTKGWQPATPTALLAEIERLRARINNALDALNDDDISGATLILYEGVREALGDE